MEETPEGMAGIPPVGTGPGMSAETASAVRGIVLAGGPLPQPVLVRPGKRLQVLLRR